MWSVDRLFFRVETLPSLLQLSLLAVPLMLSYTGWFTLQGLFFTACTTHECIMNLMLDSKMAPVHQDASSKVQRNNFSTPPVLTIRTSLPVSLLSVSPQLLLSCLWWCALLSLYFPPPAWLFGHGNKTKHGHSRALTQRTSSKKCSVVAVTVLFICLHTGTMEKSWRFRSQVDLILWFTGQRSWIRIKFWTITRVCPRVFYRGPRPSRCSLSSHILHSVVEGPRPLWVLFVYYSGIKEPTVQLCSALPQSSSCMSSPQHHCDGQTPGGRRRRREKMQTGEKGEEREWREHPHEQKEERICTVM